MRLEHPHVGGMALDMTDFDPFWDQLKGYVRREMDDNMIDIIITDIEDAVREQAYHEIKAPLMNQIDRDQEL